MKLPTMTEVSSQGYEPQHGYNTWTPELMAQRVSRKIFESRGNHSEAHLREAELTAIIEAAINLYRKCSAVQK